MHDLFYFTDVHGQLDLFQTMRDWCYKQDPECIIVFGGDACDRGKFGYDIMEAILNDPQMVYIRGNHEDMFLRAARELIANNPDIKNKMLTIDEADELLVRESWLHHVQLSLWNGGRPTLKNWLINGTSIDFLQNLAEHTCYTLKADNGLCFSHTSGKQEIFDKVNEAEYNGELIDTDDIYEMIWERYSLMDWWDKDRTIIFGHTPTQLIDDYVPCKHMEDDNVQPVAYRPHGNTGLHIAMDTGMNWSGRGYVLNCLTMQVYGFKDPNIIDPTVRQPVIQFENFKIK